GRPGPRRCRVSAWAGVAVGGPRRTGGGGRSSNQSPARPPPRSAATTRTAGPSAPATAAPSTTARSGSGRRRPPAGRRTPTAGASENKRASVDRWAARLSSTAYAIPTSAGTRQRGGDDLGSLFGRVGVRAARPGLVGQPLEALCVEPVQPG